MSDYTLAVTVPLPFAETESRTREALAGQGFGVLTEIDVRATMKKKLGVDVPAQVILGACNPPLAHEALGAEPSVAALLPCNVAVRYLGDDRTVVEAVDPGIISRLASAEELTGVARRAKEKLAAALAALPVE